MQYFKTPEHLDGKRAYILTNKAFFYFIPGELFTLSEINKMGLNPSIFEVVNIPRRSIYYSFGVRFSI